MSDAVNRSPSSSSVQYTAAGVEQLPRKQQMPATACYSCRASRQKCDRLEKCSRCLSQSIECKYPAKSNRGRKKGSTNKPASIEKILSRIKDTSAEDELLSALLSRTQDLPIHAKRRGSVQPHVSAERPGGPSAAASESYSPLTTAEGAHSDSEAVMEEPIYSPLQILAAAVAAEDRQPTGNTSTMATDGGAAYASFRPSILRSPSVIPTPALPSLPSLPSVVAPSSRQGQIIPFTNRKLAQYFEIRDPDRTDWDVLDQRQADGTQTLDLSSCDPIAARLINDEEAQHYFSLFYQLRNPMVGLMDPNLSTPSYVHTMSFTLFSVICALGAAVSDNSRDKLIAPVIYSMAEQNLKWSIANTVKSLETIQAIINMAYWAPACQNHLDDPSWLRLSYAIQLARELGIHNTSRIKRKAAIVDCDDVEKRERLKRSYQRTWLFLFIIDKTLGIVLGRMSHVSTLEIPHSIVDWWEQPYGMPSDRNTSAMVQMRIILLKALENRKRITKTEAEVAAWQTQSFNTLRAFRDAKCTMEHTSSATFLPILGFYINHALVVINAHASRDLLSAGVAMSSRAFTDISQQTADVANRIMDVLLFDRLMFAIGNGLQNLQFIMISSAATEVLHIIKCGLPLSAATSSAEKVRLTAQHIEKVAKALPATSWASIYQILLRFLCGRIEEVLEARRAHADERNPEGVLLTAGLAASAGAPTGGAGEGLGGALGGNAQFMSLSTPMDGCGLNLVDGMDMVGMGVGMGGMGFEGEMVMQGGGQWGMGF